jgi:hypothetical protein
MTYIRRGQVGPQPSKLSIPGMVAFFRWLLNLIIVFFKTIIDPQAATQIQGSSRSRSSGNYVGRGRPPGSGPRVSGLSNLRDASGAAACGAGG